MIWIYIAFAGTLFYALSENQNPFMRPLFWISGLIIAVRWFVWWQNDHSEQNAAPTLNIASSTARPDLDMFAGMRDWNEEETPADIAVASCALAGRSPAYLRSLLVAASLRDDEPGRVIAAATRRLLRAA